MKSIPFDNFTGPSYYFSNQYAAIERCINFYPTSNESKADRQFPLTLAPSPSNAPFSTNHTSSPFNQPARGLFELRGITYGVNGTCFFEIGSNGIMTNLGTVVTDSSSAPSPCTFAANYRAQIFISSFNHGYVWDTATSTFTDLSSNADFLGSSYVTFQDGYIIVANPITAVGANPAFPNQIQISGDDTTPVGDATVWNAANFSAQAGQSDYLRAILSTREYLRLFGQRRSQVLQNVGAGGVGGFPFQSYNETFIEHGIAAPWSLTDIGDGLLWVGEDNRGIRSAWYDPAFQPTRISNYAVEQAWSTYASFEDAIGFSFIWKGHLFWQITFQTDNHTWVYDVTESRVQGQPIWHERTALIGTTEQARPERYHCYCFNLHLVSSLGTDGAPGAIYRYADDLFVDYQGTNPVSVIRTRITPHVWNGFNRIIYDRIEFELARGVGDTSAPNPSLQLSWSDDAGNTWSTPVNLPVGAVGQFKTRVAYNRMGYSRDRIFKIACSDPVYWGIIGAQLSVRQCAS